MLDLNYLKAKKHIIKPLAVIAVILILDFVFILRGQVGFLGKIVPRANNLRRDITIAKKDIASQDELAARHERLKLESPRTEKKIIQEEEIPLFLSEISTIAKAARVKVMKIKPSDLTSEQAKDARGQRYFRLPVSLDLKCGYHQLSTFINKLETSPRYIKVLSFDVSSVIEAPFEYPVKMNIETIVLKK